MVLLRLADETLSVKQVGRQLGIAKSTLCKCGQPENLIG